MITTRLLDIQYAYSYVLHLQGITVPFPLLPSSLSDIFLCIKTLNIYTPFLYVKNCSLLINVDD